MARGRAVVAITWALLFAALLALVWRDRPRPAAKAAPTVSSSLRVLFLGDSVCTTTAGGKPGEAPVASVGMLFAKLLWEREPRLRREGWTLDLECAPGLSGYEYLGLARQILAGGQRPKLALVTINPRSLNLLGDNGFLKGGSQVPQDGPEWEPDESWAHQFRVLQQAYRIALKSLNRALVQPFVPQRLDDGEARDEEAILRNVRVVYGKGFRLDARVLKGLLETAALLRASGCQVLFFVTPYDRVSLARRLGPPIVAQVDAGIAEATAVLRAGAYPVADFSAIFPDGFVEPPSEHLNGLRRQQLAAVLADFADRALSGLRVPMAHPSTERLRRAAGPSSL